MSNAPTERISVYLYLTEIQRLLALLAADKRTPDDCVMAIQDKRIVEKLERAQRHLEQEPPRALDG